MTATSPYLNHPTRTEREAQLERRVAELEACLTWALADIEGRAITTPDQHAACLSRCLAALSNMRGLHDPVRTEREAQLEAALSALVNAKALSGVREMVAGWNGENRPEGPFLSRHPARLGAVIRTNCGAVYDLDEAMTNARLALSTTASRGGDDEQP